MTSEETARGLLDAFQKWARLMRLPERDELIDRIATALATAEATGRKDRDFEWWQACALVDNVAPEPEAVKAWNIALTDLAYHEGWRAGVEAALFLGRPVNRLNGSASVSFWHGR